MYTGRFFFFGMYIFFKKDITWQFYKNRVSDMILQYQVGGEKGYEGLVKITIQDYQYCTPTTIYVYVVEKEILDVIKSFNINNNNTNVGIIKFEDFLKNVVIFNNDAE